MDGYSKSKKGINQLGYAALFYMANFENKMIQSAAEISSPTWKIYQTEYRQWFEEKNMIKWMQEKVYYSLKKLQIFMSKISKTDHRQSELFRNSLSPQLNPKMNS